MPILQKTQGLVEGDSPRVALAHGQAQHVRSACAAHLPGPDDEQPSQALSSRRLRNGNLAYVGFVTPHPHADIAQHRPCAVHDHLVARIVVVAQLAYIGEGAPRVWE